MSIHLNALILQKKEELENELSQLQKAKRPYKGARLYFTKDRNRYKYYYRKQTSPPSAKEYLNSGDRKLLLALAREERLRRRESDIELMLRAIRAYCRVYEKHTPSQNMLISSSESYRLSAAYQSLVPPKDALQQSLLLWSSEPFRTNPLFPEHRNVEVTKQLFVRSKSEALIASALLDSKIPFRYEAEFQSDSAAFYPDFTIRHPKTGEYYIWEHFGLLSQPEYLKNALQKIQKYIESGYVPDKTLLLTYETPSAPLSVELIHRKIEEAFL